MIYSTLFMAAVANAHLFIASPSPIPGSAPKDPLLPDGSNFPCHGAAFPGANGKVMPVGSTQLLAFDNGNGDNTATHGGGSCQISVTYETDKAKIRDPKNWYVIESIEGGCPTNSPGNLDGIHTGPSGSYVGAQQCSNSSTNGFDCINSFNFQLPKGMKNGQATLAWTWFNTIGNREMYMNCVAIDVTGGASDDSQMQDLPGLFVANLAASDLPGSCHTTEQSNVAFPQPGPVLQYKKPSPRMAVASASSQYPMATPSGCPNMARNGDSAQPSIVSDAAVPSFAAASAGSQGSTSYMGAAQTQSAAAGSPTVFSNASSKESTSGAGSCAAGSVACSTPGALVCPDSQHFGICDINNCAVVGAVSPGTVCQNGAIAAANAGAKRDEDVRKRMVRFARRHQHLH